MKRLLAIALCALLLLPSVAFAQFIGSPSGGSGSIVVKESDGTPNVTGVTTITVTNGSLTDNGSGEVTVATSGAANVTIGSSTVTTGTAGAILTVGAGPLLQQVSLTGLVLGNGASQPTAYGGVTCTAQVLRILSNVGAGTCVTLTSAYVDTSIWTGTLSSGIPKATSQGVFIQATAGTDYASPAVANTWADGVRQTFNPSTTTAGINVGATTTDPSSGSNGDIYYDSGTNKLRCYQAAAWVDCIGSGGGSNAFSALTSSTNTTAAMLVGAGASLATDGGTITATAVTANSVALTTDTTGNYVSSATANMGLLLTGTEGASLGLIQTCASNEILKWNGSAWACSVDSTGGTPTFTDVATGANTTSTMTCGAGCSVVPTSTGVIAGTSLRPTVLTVNAGNSPYAPVVTDRLILCDTTAAARIINLPVATVKVSLNIKNIGANTCTINRNGTDTIDGGTDAILTVQYESIGLDSDGTATWEIF